MSSTLDAAELLEQRRHFEGVPFERYTHELWSQIDEKLPGFGPPWLRELSLRFRIAGAAFQLMIDEGDHWKGRCVIPRPSNALWYICHPSTHWVIASLSSTALSASRRAATGMDGCFGTMATRIP